MNNVIQLKTEPTAFMKKLNKLEAFNRLSELEHRLLRGDRIDFKEYFELYNIVFKPQNKDENSNVTIHPAMKRQNRLRSLKIQKLQLMMKGYSESEKDNKDEDLLAEVDRELFILDTKINHFQKKWRMK
jgi:hypothetical protein